MRVAFDHNVPRQLRRKLSGHYVQTASESEWALLSNGDILRTAEQTGFDILLTCDNDFLRYRNAKRKIALICLSTNHWPSIEQSHEMIRAALERATVGSFEQVTIKRILPRNV